MMYVWIVLKIIGILLLTVLGIVLLTLLVILFVPIRYRADADIQREVRDARIAFRVTWLCHLVSFRFQMEQQRQTAWLRILFFTKKLYPKEILPDEEEAAAMAEQTAEHAKDALLGEELEEAVSDGEPEMDGAGESVPKKEHAPKSHTRKEKEKRIDRESKLHAISEKARLAKERAGDFSGFFHDGENREAFRYIGRVLGRLLHRIRPRVLRLRAVFSTGKPDLTGELLGVLAMFPIWYRNRWQISPDFLEEDAYVEGDLFVRGHIRIVHLTIATLRVLLSSRCRRLYHKGKQLL